MTATRDIEPAEDAVAAVWRKALWILEALPPRRAKGALGGVHRQRKLAAYVRDVVCASGPAERSLNDTITGNVPFLFALMWWASEREVEHEALNDHNLFQHEAGSALVSVAGSRPAAHAALAAFARRRAKNRDDAFSEASIRAQLVAELQRAGTVHGTDVGLPKEKPLG